ncbi:MAG: Verru_Chthon cassette protein A, partial [Verrucomicrobiaceae bacterium]
FPIIDPRVQTAAGTSVVDGFSYSKTMLKKDGSSVSVNQVDTGGSGADKQRVPMPVKWIYVLKDGTLTAPRGVDGTGKIANWTGASASKIPTASNPIVGRIAFWTDDETCKINVNTASEPTAWDTPRAVCIQDLKNGLYAPANKEFQRYPGHPFMTALSPVFFPGTATATLTEVQRKAIYDFVPRVQYGGSQGGTISVGGEQVVTPDSDRLFANFDECLFSAAAPVAGKRVQSNIGNASGTNIFTVDFLNQRRFFLTANSRAPEINLFGRPRVSLWPESSTVSQRTAFDKLAAFCSSTLNGTYPCYFQRASPTSSTADYIGIGRNQQIYSYLQNLTQSAVPGFGGDFKTKWGDDRDQILTEIFDYIRCANLHDNSSGAAVFAGNGQVAPIRIDSNKTMGFGRFQTISQFGIHLICGQDGPNGLSTVAGSGVTALPAGQRLVEAALLFEPFSCSQGFFTLTGQLSYEVTVKSPMSVGGKDLQFPTGAVTVGTGDGFNCGFHARTWGGAQGVRGLINSFGAGGYRLLSKRVQVPATGTSPTMDFSGGTVEVKVYSSTSPAAANLVQTFTIKFPQGTFPVPNLVTTGTSGCRGCGDTAVSYWWSFANRYSGTTATPQTNGTEYADPTRRWAAGTTGLGFRQGSVFRAEDVVRTMVPVHGDIRLISAQPTPDCSVLFDKGSRYDDTTRRIDHLFQESEGSHFLYGFANEPGLTSATGDQLTPAKYHYAKNPEIRPGAGKLYNKWNDFDNGAACVTDGAYINKPDEGNVSNGNGSQSYTYFSWDFSNPGSNLYSPNRLVPSAGMLGSLSTGLKRNLPWQTLLFRPDVSNPPHPGAASPKDHLIMDLFWMPVIEPYAISEPFSTAGKINLNYAIAPFSYIRRATGL